MQLGGRSEEKQAASPAADQQPVEVPDVHEPKEWQRFYMGYKERFCDDCTIHLANGAVVNIAQAPSAAKLLGPGPDKQAGASGHASQHTSSSSGRGSRGGRKGSGTDSRAGSRSMNAQEQLLDRRSDPALTGTTVWDGAIVLAQYLTATSVLQQRTWPCRRQRPIACELGAGTGAVSLSLLASGVVEAAVITDIPDMLPHLRANVARNAAAVDAGAAYVRALNWATAAEDAASLGVLHGPPFDLIVGSDLIYYSYSEATPHSRLLLSALHALSGPETDIYLALSLHHNPGEVSQFLAWAAEDGFRVQAVPAEQLPEEYCVGDVRVVRLRLDG